MHIFTAKPVEAPAEAPAAAADGTAAETDGGAAAGGPDEVVKTPEPTEQAKAKRSSHFLFLHERRRGRPMFA